MNLLGEPKKISLDVWKIHLHVQNIMNLKSVHVYQNIGLTARPWTMSVKNDCKSMSVKLRYWIVKTIYRDTARPLVSRRYFERSST